MLKQLMEHKDLLLAFTGIVSALTALISGIVGPFVAYRIAKNQIKSTLVSQNRVKWIEELRKDIATFSETQYSLIHQRIEIAEAIKNDAKNEEIEELKKIYKSDVGKANLAATLIRLKLNPKEKIVSELLEKIDEMIKITSNTNRYTKENIDIANTYRFDIEDLSLILLKSEWEKTKRLH
ncbi:hypothetical protein [Sediminicoccus sp. BL-A-41-H5]|uniref:hypothetical protein n=1 Tax=Sediminicoccus sp. BL-A-41-H5 TaxID=3421106 RepID=UPI003D668D85